MAQYKVPQDVEADDKLIGPFSFRQFIYLLICAGLIALCIPLFQLFPLLIIIPMPFILFLLALSLPLKKDQPMETYLSAVISFYMKPHNRLWEPGEPESTIVITAPKKTDEVHLKGLSQEEATHRLSFLAEIVDTEGYAIKGNTTSGVREDIIAEANATQDIFDTSSTTFSQQNIQQTADTHHAELVNQMREAIAKNNNLSSGTATISHSLKPQAPQQPNYSNYYASAEPTAAATPVTPLPPYSQAVATQVSPNLPPPTFVTNITQAQPNPILNTPAQTTSGPTLESIQAELNQLAPQANASPVDTPNANLSYDSNPLDASAISSNENIIKPDLPLPDEVVEQITAEEQGNSDNEYIPADLKNQTPAQPSQDLIDLANNSDFSIETIARQAKRINEKQQENEVYISLH